MPDDPGDFGGPKALVGAAEAMARQATAALEAITGLPAEAFVGTDQCEN